jgi:predicted helicase
VLTLNTRVINLPDTGTITVCAAISRLDRVRDSLGRMTGFPLAPISLSSARGAKFDRAHAMSVFSYVWQLLHGRRTEDERRATRIEFVMDPIDLIRLAL